MQVASIAEGDLLADRYRVERVLGSGGMGVVVSAIHVQLEQRVAVKFLLPETCDQRDVVSRFLREARAAAKIRSEHVGQVIDFGTLASGAPFMVMEYLAGVDLARLIRERGPLPIDEAIEYTLQACEGIAEAHAIEVVHRDIKPANLFLTQRSDGSPLIKVLDFGISKAKNLDSTDASYVSMTMTGAVLGSPAYMSPEQVRSAKDIDVRTDIWSLGVVLHELLTGHPVYQATTISALLAMIAADPPPPLRSLRADIPAELERIVLCCLSKQRDERYASIGELARALEPFAPPRALVYAKRAQGVLRLARGEENPKEPHATGNAQAMSAESAESMNASRVRELSPSPPRRLRAAWIALAAMVLALGTLLAYLVFSSRERSERTHDGSTAPRDTTPSNTAPATAGSQPGFPVATVSSAPPQPAAAAPVASAEVLPHASASPRSRPLVNRAPVSPHRAEPTNSAHSASSDARHAAPVATADRGANPF